jgi:hypothetical protein
MTPDQEKRLEGMSRQGQTVKFKNKGKPGYQEIGKVVDEVYIMVDDYKHLIQKIEFKDGVSWDGSKFAYRTGYYTYDGQMKNIKWGQYTQFLTEKEYKALLSKAKEKGWILC